MVLGILKRFLRFFYEFFMKCDVLLKINGNIILVDIGIFSCMMNFFFNNFKVWICNMLCVLFGLVIFNVV